MKIRIEIRSLDVWGNEFDGYEVNDILGTIGDLEIDSNITESKLVNLVSEEFLIGSPAQYAFDDFSCSGHIFGNIVHKNSMMPIVEVRSVQ